MNGQTEEMSTPISQLGNAPPSQSAPLMPGGSGGATASTVPMQMPVQQATPQAVQQNGIQNMAQQPVQQVGAQQAAQNMGIQQHAQPIWNNPLPMNMNPYGLSNGLAQEIAQPSKLNMSNNTWDALSILILFICLNTSTAFKASNSVLPTIHPIEKTPTITGVVIHGCVAAGIYFLVKKFI